MAAGGNATVIIASPGATVASTPTEEVIESLFHAGLARMGILPGATTSDVRDERVMSAVEDSLAREVDSYCALLKAGFPIQASSQLEALLSKLPAEATPYITFRIKANIGYCYLQRGDKDMALEWFDDAVARIPQEPKAVAVKAFTLLIRGQAQEAAEFATAELSRYPDNEDLAAHLIEAAIHCDDETDPDSKIPAGLRERERVLMARCVYARQRDRRPEWWNMARLGAKRYPSSTVLKLFAAEAIVDQIVRRCRNDTHRPLTEPERGMLREAANELEAIWHGLKRSEVPTRDDGIAALSAAIIARSLLLDREQATTLTRELIERTVDEQALFIAVQMAQVLDNEEIEKAALEKLADTGFSGFLKGFHACCKGDWAKAASYFRQAEIPEVERGLAAVVEAVANIASLEGDAAKGILETGMRMSGSDARALIVVWSIASKKGLIEIAAEAYNRATQLIEPTLSFPARVMIASAAYRKGDFDVVIRALDGHVETHAVGRELQWLADAHAGEWPPRRRNLAFFDRLPRETLQANPIARAYASKLLDMDKATEAAAVFERVIRQAPNDVFAHLRLAEALKRLGREDEAIALIVNADEAKMSGPSVYCLRWAHALRDAGAPNRALSYAFGLLRSHPHEPRIALGYVGLIFASRSETIIPSVDRVEPDCWVAIEAASGESDSFVIDDGPAFLGLDVVPPDHDRAKRVLGFRIGQSFEAKHGLNDNLAWSIKEVKSKYLAAFHTVMEDFQKRFPSARGLWRISVPENDAQPVLDMIRDQAIAKKETIQSLYVNSHIPFSFVARSVGTDPMSMAHYLNTMQFDIATSGGAVADREAGLSAARKYRGKGATLDTYTAVVATEMDCLDDLKSWFGSLAVASSTLDDLEDMITEARANLGKSALSFSWKDGQFFREEMTDELLDGRIRQIEKVRTRIAQTCEIIPVAFPDDLSSEVLQFTRAVGRQDMCPMYLAASRNDLLLSEDFHYRQLAAGLTQVTGSWLQMVLAAAHAEAQLSGARYAHGCAHLAFRRHGNLWIDVDLLMLVFDTCNEDEASAICRYIGAPQAEMGSHTALAATFLRRLWQRSDPGLKREAFTSLLIDSIVRHRGNHWPRWLAFLYLGAEDIIHLRSHIVRWSDGHFLPREPIESAAAEWEQFLRQARRFRLLGDRAMSMPSHRPHPLELGAAPPFRSYRNMTNKSKSRRRSAQGRNVRPTSRHRAP